MLAAAASLVIPLHAAEQHPSPSLPVAPRWSVELRAGVAVAPVNDGERIYLALRTGEVVAVSPTDGRELWRIAKSVATPMEISGGLLLFAAGDAIEAVHGKDGTTAWIAPRLKATAPLVAAATLLIVSTNTELAALDPKDGSVAWRFQAGGVSQAPAVSGDRVFAGANDGRIVALELASGRLLWEAYVDGGVTSFAAYRDRVYAGGGDKQFHAFDAGRGAHEWSRRIGANPEGAIAVDDERVYFSARDNVVRALDRGNGNQRWQARFTRRPAAGVHLAGHVLFLQVGGTELLMLYDRTGERSGTIALPAETARDTPPDVRESASGLTVTVVTGSLSNQWHLTLIARAYEALVEPFTAMGVPGLPFLTDPEVVPIGRAVPWLVLSDPPLRPAAASGWPFVLRDPPLEPLSTIPGLQLRPLSPVLPVRRGG